MLLSITGKLDTQKLSSALSQVTNWHKLGIKLGIPPAEIKENSRPSFSSFLPPSLLPSLPCALPSLFLSQLTKSEDVARNCRSRCERQVIPYYWFSPELDEIISTIEHWWEAVWHHPQGQDATRGLPGPDGHSHPTLLLHRCSREWEWTALSGPLYCIPALVMLIDNNVTFL